MINVFLLEQNHLLAKYLPAALHLQQVDTSGHSLVNVVQSGPCEPVTAGVLMLVDERYDFTPADVVDG